MMRTSQRERFGFRIYFQVAGALALIFASSTAWAATESEVKAVMLLGFAQLSEWTAPLPALATFQICLLGETEIEPALRAAAKGETALDRPIRVARVSSLDSARSCQILFVSESLNDDFSESIENIGDTSTLFVGDFPGFTELGGAIEFYSEAERVRFAVSRRNAQNRGIRLSSRILSRARLVENER